jgi:hypothetical protein
MQALQKSLVQMAKKPAVPAAASGARKKTTAAHPRARRQKTRAAG